MRPAVDAVDGEIGAPDRNVAGVVAGVDFDRVAVFGLRGGVFDCLDVARSADRSTRPLAFGCAPAEGGAGGAIAAAVAGAAAGGAMPGIGATSCEDDLPGLPGGAGIGGSSAALALLPLLGPKLMELMSRGSTGRVMLRPSFRWIVISASEGAASTEARPSTESVV